MGFSARAVLLVLHAVLYLDFPLFSQFMAANASPIPPPLPLILNRDYSLSLISANRTFPRLNGWPLGDVAASGSDSLSKLQNKRRDLTSPADLHDRYNTARRYGEQFQSLVAGSSDIQEDDDDFQRNSAANLSGFNAAMTDYAKILASTTSDKGLQNSDRMKAQEITLKDLINCTKEIIKSVDVLVEKLPILGPLLGPIVYEIKCSIDQILDAVGHSGDEAIESLGPLLQLLLKKAIFLCCKLGVPLLVFCL